MLYQSLTEAKFLAFLTRARRGLVTPEQEAQLSQIASHAGKDTERLVKDAALRLLEQDARFRAAVREAIAPPRDNRETR